MPSDLPPQDDAPQEGVIEVPYNRLSPDALEGILEEFVSREGTDYGDYDYSLADKKEHVRAQLQRGDAIILFDPVSANCHIEVTRVLRAHGWSGGQDG